MFNAFRLLLTASRHVAVIPRCTYVGRMAPESARTTVRVSTVVAGGGYASVWIHGVLCVRMRERRL